MSDTHESTLPASAIADVEPEPRLAPRDGFAGIWLGVLRAAFRLAFGKVMMPLRVIFPRIPGYAFPHLCLLFFLQRLRLPRALVHTLSLRISRNRRCAFCYDLHAASFMLERPPAEVFAHATRDIDDPALDATTRMVLCYADELTRDGEISDGLFAELHARFDERELVELVWVGAFVSFTNLLARPLRLRSDGFCAIAARKTA